jgi:integrase
MIITNDKKKFKDISIEIPTKVEDPIFDAGHNASPTSVMIEELEVKESEPTPEEPEPTPEPDTSFQAYIKEVYDNLKNDAELVYKKKTLSTADYQLIQSFIIVSLLGGMFIKPRKSKDYVDFNIKNIDETNDNHIQKDKLIFNTAEKEIVEIPKPLQSILKKWISINPTEYLLFDTNKNKLSSVKLNQRLNKIFNNKKVSINALIQSFIH